MQGAGKPVTHLPSTSKWITVRAGSLALPAAASTTWSWYSPTCTSIEHDAGVAPWSGWWGRGRLISAVDATGGRASGLLEMTMASHGPGCGLIGLVGHRRRPRPGRSTAWKSTEPRR